MQVLGSKSTNFRLRSPAFGTFSYASDIGNRCGFRMGIVWFSLLLLCDCTPKPADIELPASAPPARLQPIDPPDPIPQFAVPKKTSEKHGEHKSHSRTKQIEIVAAIEPSALLGKEPSDVKKLLGDPADVSKRDVSLVWTYGSADCAFQVYFYPDLKTSMFHALQYSATTHAGEKIDLSQGCIKRLLVARK